ncbi:type III pantothenate kinase [Allostreptomyces psammosilenae]|uniref:Type III pantothenate kinase n=1 Tax=Allostreptomyces psammosilenae TaxID=1892865 RepID=A0A852ZUX4_9ACTN|nr:type III pantothenate kinase [Allostreptomyces psammosilenae]NYI05725.1 type III pantothenate kinase [Allostreptomyces psammosilenae]
MLLTIDAGNTQTVLGLFDGDRLVAHWRLSTDPRRTADELATLLRGLMASHPEAAGRSVTGICVCCQVPVVLPALREMMAGHFPEATGVVIGPGVRTGLPVLTDNPKEVGADRIVNALAAVTRYGPGPCVVVDLGTATTFDAINARGQYVGGAIAPGIAVSMDALKQHGAQLRTVEPVRPRSVIGRNTVEALQSGIVFGFAGQVDGVVRRMLDELVAGTSLAPEDVPVIATGGLAPIVLGEARTITVHDPWLTLTGLRLVYERTAAREGRGTVPDRTTGRADRV